MNRDQWLDAATTEIRFPLDRARVRRELEGHWEDAVDAARGRGLSSAEAEAQALAAMGDPDAIAPEWLDVTIGDAVLRIDLEGGGGT